MPGDVRTDRGQCDRLSEAAYRQNEQLLNGQPPRYLFSDHLTAVAVDSSHNFWDLSAPESV